tara:strand:+ start:382 stop:1341 length:960 start_codon:yes stop_codon:yes gene_type:complete
VNVAADLQPLLDLRRSDLVDIEEVTPDQLRTSYEEIAGMVMGTPAAMDSVEDLVVRGGEDQDLPIRIYRPPGFVDGGPVIVYFHGGGWVIGSVDTHDEPCRAIAEATSAVVVSVDYRLAPEHPFPAAIDDGFAAVCWVARHAEDLGVDAGRLVVAGDSAGGNLSAVVSIVARDRGGPAIAFQYLIYPATDFDYETGRWSSLEENAEGYFLQLDTMRWFRNHLAGGADLLDNPLAAPIRAADHSGLPPAHVLVAGFDPLRDEGLGYAEVLRGSGVSATAVLHADQVHGYWQFAPIVQSSGAARAADLQEFRSIVVSLQGG